MIRRCKILWLIFFLLTLPGCRNEPLEPSKFTVGIYMPAKELGDLIKGFEEGLSRNGYLENSNLEYIKLHGDHSPEAFRDFINQVTTSSADVIFTATTPGALKLKNSLKDQNIPVVFSLVGWPVESGLVENLTYPGGNFTGIQARGAGEKGFVWLKRMVPNLKRVYVPYNPEDMAMPVSLPDLVKAADRHQVELVVKEFFSKDELPAILNSPPKDVQVLWQLPSPFWSAIQKDVIESAIAHKLALKVHSLTTVKEGAMMGYGFNETELGKQAARIADKILRGSDPSDIPVEQTSFYLSLNLKTAREINMDIPETLIKEADVVIR